MNTHNNILISRITSEQPKILSKTYKLDALGNLHKSTSAQLVVGTVERIEIADVDDFVNLLTDLDTSQALCYGVEKNNNQVILSTKQHEKIRMDGTTTRTSDNFIWNKGGGILMLDFDYDKDRPVTGYDDLINKLSVVLPEIVDTSHVYWESSSSHIYHGDKDLTGLRGQRLYIFVKDATDIERAGKVIADRLWLVGMGHYVISRSGALLERTLVDASVWQPTRLDFAAGAECIEPLRQVRDYPIAHYGQILDTRMHLNDLGIDELKKLKNIKDKASASLGSDVEIVKQQYINECAKTADKETIEQALNMFLTGSFVVMLANDNKVSVRDIVANPGVYDKAITKDPLEPEYDNYKNVGRIYFNHGSVVINSMAHGGRVFKLSPKSVHIEDVRGQELATARTILSHMEQDRICCTMGGQLYKIADGVSTRLDIDRLRNWIDTHYQLYITRKDIRVNVSCRDLILKSIIAEDARINPVDGVITAPVIDNKGRITQVGYDKDAGLYYYPGKSDIQVPEEVSKDMAQEAFQTLMAPFNEFACAEELDRTALQCAVLTSIMRPYFTKCPAIVLDAPVYGTGKTFLAQCLGALGTGQNVSVLSGFGSEKEMQKLIMTKMMEDSRVMLLDNIMGRFNSVSLVAYLTSDIYEGRILGSNEKFSSKAKMLVLLTGNNMTLGGDMARRVIRVTLDSKVEDLSARVFSGNPLNYILGNRADLVQAGLTVIRGYLQSGMVKKGSMESFEQWDEMIRQPVLWLTGKDILDKVRAEKEDNSDNAELGAFLSGLKLLMGDSSFTSKDLVQRLAQVSMFEIGNKKTIEVVDAGNDIYDYLRSLNCIKGGELSSLSVGMALKYRVNRIVNGSCLISEKGHGNVTKYRVCKK